MKFSEKNKTVNYLLTHLTYILLSNEFAKDAMGKAAQRHEARLKTILAPDEFKPIGTMRDTIVLLAQKLASCESEAELQKTHDYFQKLLDGDVMIAVPDAETGEITHLEKNASPNLGVS